MARPTVYTWPAAVTTAVCLAQGKLAAGNLIINGTLAVTASAPDANAVTPYAIWPGISRTVSLTTGGGANLSGVNFTIKGTYKGAVQSETRVGPNNNTVFTTALFDTVTSVSIDATLGGGVTVSVGSGTTGQTQWFEYNHNASVCAMTVVVIVTGTINYTFQATLDPVGPQFASPNVFQPIYTMISQTASEALPLGVYAVNVSGGTDSPIYAPTPVKHCNILVNSATTGTLVATFMQQGVT